MGAGAVQGVLPETVEEALERGYTQEEIDAYLLKAKTESESNSKEGSNNIAVSVSDSHDATTDVNTATTSPSPNANNEDLQNQSASKNRTIKSFPFIKKGSLTMPNVFCRVRPFGLTGGHTETDEKQAKILSGWDESCVTLETEYMFSKSDREYRFPRHVFGPEATQENVFEKVAPEVVDSFVNKNFDVMLLAYGQTGTGKTHTMFGTDASLAGNSVHEMGYLL